MTAQTWMIDVSSLNHPSDEAIDWAKVKAAGYGAVMVKATEGTGYINPWLIRDAAGANDAGLRVGYYHFAHPDESGPDTQARFALEAIAGLPRTLGLALDLEVSGGLSWEQLALWAHGFHSWARTVVDHSPLYVNDYYLNSLPGAPWGWWLWLAQTQRPRRQVWAWQRTSPGAVDGIASPTDVGVLYGS